MRNPFTRRHALPLFAVPFLAAAGVAGVAGVQHALAVPTAGAATRSPPATDQAASVQIATFHTASDVPTEALMFRVVPEQSKATFRVREQLVGFSLPSDAVGTTGAVSGDLALRPDGALVGGASKITVDLRELQTDSTRRDGFIEQNTLQTTQFPIAEFVPTGATGLPNPLPATGEYAFTLTGLMTVHGVQREIAWQTTAARQGDRLTGHATATVAFGDFGMSPPQVPVVLSVVDEIRLELDLVATQAS